MCVFIDDFGIKKIQKNVHKRLYFLGIQIYIFFIFSIIFELFLNFFLKKEKSILPTAKPLANHMVPRRAAQRHEHALI